MARRGTAIRDVRTHVLEAPLRAPFAYSQAWYAARGAMLVEITTEDGVTAVAVKVLPPHNGVWQTPTTRYGCGSIR